MRIGDWSSQPARRRHQPSEEEVFQQQIITAARDLFGWRVYHTRDSRGSTAGYPDLTMVRGGQIIFAEVKRQAGKTDVAQDEWIYDLEWAASRTVGHVRVFVWRPSDWNRIVEVLGGKE